MFMNRKVMSMGNDPLTFSYVIIIDAGRLNPDYPVRRAA